MFVVVCSCACNEKALPRHHRLIRQQVNSTSGKHVFNESRAVVADSESTCLANSTFGQTAMHIRIQIYIYKEEKCKVERSCMKGHERSQRVSFLTGQSLVRLVSFVLFFICAIRVIVFHCPLSLLPTIPHSLDDSPAEHRKQQTDLREIVVQICHPKVGKYNMYVYIYM